MTSAFVARMLGRLPALPTPPPLPKVEAPRLRPGKRVLEPTSAEIAQVDAVLIQERLAKQGIYLTPAAIRDLVAETNTALWEENRRKR